MASRRLKASVEERGQSAGRPGLACAAFAGLDVTGKTLDSSNWSIVDHVPVIVEFIDRADRIAAFFQMLDKYITEGHQRRWNEAHVLLYRRESVVEDAPKLAMPVPPPAPVVPLSTLPAAEEFPIMQLE